MNEDMFKKLSNMLENSNDSNSNARSNNSNNSDNLKNILSNFVSGTQNNSSNVGNNTGSTTNNNSSNSGSSSDNLNGFDFSNIDMETIMKIKNIMSKINTRGDDPRSNLLMSLKPYLKPSKKERLDQCMKFMSLSSVMEAFNNVGGDIKK